MRKRKTKWLSLLLIFAVSLTTVFGSTGFAQAASYDQTKAAFIKCGDYLYNENEAPRFGSIGGEWIIYALGHAGYAMSDAYLAAYRKSVENALEEGYRGTKGIFHDKKFTEYSRVIVAMSAVGMDATNVSGYEPVVNQMATDQVYYALAFFYKSVPDKTALSKAAKAGNGKLKVTWKKAVINTDYVTKQSGKTAEVSGYQIVCATDKKFTKSVVKTTVSGKSLTKTVTGLKKGKTYYVKVRAYKTVNGKKLYGLYSSVKSQKV